MNLVLIEEEELQPDRTVVLRDRRCLHLNQVLRSKPGDRIRMGLVNGPVGSGVVLSISPEEARLAVSLTASPPALPSTDLILALPRPLLLKRVLAQAAAMGVGRLFLINARRVEKSFFSASLLRDNGWRPFLQAGLEQARDTRLPELFLYRRFRPFAEDILPGLLPGYSQGLVAHPESAHALPELIPPPLTGRVLLAVGPEGGWVDHEIELFREAKLVPFSIGPRILRLDTAVPALLAQLDLLRRL